MAGSLSVLAFRPLRFSPGSIPARTSRCPSYRPSIPPSHHGQLSLRALRNNSTADSAPEVATKPGNAIKKAILRTTLVVAILGCYVYFTDTRASAHRYIVVPLMRWLYPDAEDAHHAGVRILGALYRNGLHPRERRDPDRDGGLSTEVRLRCQPALCLHAYLSYLRFLDACCLIRLEFLVG
jgi:dihydroorotate dehydrogenase